MSSITMKSVIAAVSSIVPFIPSIIEYFQEDTESLSSEQLQYFRSIVSAVEEYTGQLDLPEWVLVCAHTNSLYRKVITIEEYQRLYYQPKEK